MCRIGATILNSSCRQPTRSGPFSFGLSEVLTTVRRKMCYDILHMVLGLYILWNDLMHEKGT
jgi:hypothetical protein